MVSLSLCLVLLQVVICLITSLLAGLLSKWREVPSGKFECSLGIHARRNSNHSGRGVQSEERARDLSREERSPGAWVLVSILVPNFSSLCIIEGAVVLQWEVSEEDVSECGKN